MPNFWKKQKAKKAEAVAAAHAGHEVAESNHSTEDYGLFILVHGPSDAAVDIVLVHGITGNRLTTWSASSTPPVIWAQTLLPQDIPRARIATWGYDADVLNFWSQASRNRVGEHAGNLLSAVTGWRDSTNTTDRPIIFIAHSLGGIVVQDALLQSFSSPEPHLRQVLPCTIGIAFLGTPHHGADLAAWAKSLTNFCSITLNRKHTNIIGSLEPENEVLSRIQRDFWGLVRRRNEGELGGKLGIACFYEELSMRVLGVIVDRSSATVNGYLAVGIRKTHEDMGKFESARELGYVSLVNEVRRWAQGVRNASAIETATAATMVLPLRGIADRSARDTTAPPSPGGGPSLGGAPPLGRAPSLGGGSSLGGGPSLRGGPSLGGGSFFGGGLSLGGGWGDLRAHSAEMEAPPSAGQSARPRHFSSSSAPVVPQQPQSPPGGSLWAEARQQMEAGQFGNTRRGKSSTRMPLPSWVTQEFGDIGQRPGSAPPSRTLPLRDPPLEPRHLPARSQERPGREVRRVREGDDEAWEDSWKDFDQDSEDSDGWRDEKQAPNNRRRTKNVIDIPGVRITQHGSVYNNNVSGNARVIQGSVFTQGGIFNFN